MWRRWATWVNLEKKRFWKLGTPFKWGLRTKKLQMFVGWDVVIKMERIKLRPDNSLWEEIIHFVFTSQLRDERSGMYNRKPTTQRELVEDLLTQKIEKLKQWQLNTRKEVWVWYECCYECICDWFCHTTLGVITQNNAHLSMTRSIVPWVVVPDNYPAMAIRFSFHPIYDHLKGFLSMYAWSNWTEVLNWIFVL